MNIKTKKQSFHFIVMDGVIKDHERMGYGNIPLTVKCTITKMGEEGEEVARIQIKPSTNIDITPIFANSNNFHYHPNKEYALVKNKDNKTEGWELGETMLKLIIKELKTLLRLKNKRKKFLEVTKVGEIFVETKPVTDKPLPAPSGFLSESKFGWKPNELSQNRQPFYQPPQQSSNPHDVIFKLQQTVYEMEFKNNILENKVRELEGRVNKLISSLKALGKNADF